MRLWSSHINKTAKKYPGIQNLRSKFIYIVGDRCPSNFGGINREGDEHLFARLWKEFDWHCCTTHLGFFEKH